MGESGVIWDLAFSAEVFDEISKTLAFEYESAGVLLAGIAHDAQGITLLGRRFFPVADEHYSLRTAVELRIVAEGYIAALGEAHREGAVPIFVHTHPGGHPAHSLKDDQVDDALREVFTRRTRNDLYASLVLGGSPEAATFAARMWRSTDGPFLADRLRVVGERLTFLFAEDQNQPSERFDRQVRAFGKVGQLLLSRLRVAVVGGGGTGSAVFEQLVRLGVGRVIVVDGDVIDDANLTRIHEAAAFDVGRQKVEVLANRAAAIGGGTEIVTVGSKLRTADVVDAIKRSDIVFGCTDDEFGRSILSRLAYYYLNPLFDISAKIDSLDGQLREIYGRVTTVMPGTSCLLCRKVVQPARIAAEAMTPEERRALAGEGYAPELDGPAPAVITFTTAAATMALNELFGRLFGYGPEPAPSEVLWRFVEKDIRRSRVLPKPNHYCVDRSVWGRGDCHPSLGVIWPDA